MSIWVFLHFYWNACVFILDVYELFIYSGSKTFVICLVIIVLPVYSLLYIFLMCFDQQKLLIVMKSILSIFFSYGQCFSKKSLPTPGCQSFGYFFFSWKVFNVSFDVSFYGLPQLTFCTWCEKVGGGGEGGSRFIFSVFYTGFPPSITCPKDYRFHPLNYLGAFIEINWFYIGGSNSGFSFLFHWFFFFYYMLISILHCLDNIVFISLEIN